MPIDESDITLIRSLRNTRNAIEHFSWKTTRQEASAIIGQALSFAVHFAQKELGYDLSYHFRKDDTWKQLIENSAAFVKGNSARIERLEGAGEFDYACDFCNAMTISRYGGSCTLCGHWNQADPDDPF